MRPASGVLLPLKNIPIDEYNTALSLFFSIPLEATSYLQSPVLYLTICTICNMRKLWISLLKWWAYALEYDEHRALFVWIAANVINSLKKHPGNSFRSILSTRWPQTSNHMKKCWEGKHGLIQENRNHMVEGEKINKAVLQPGRGLLTSHPTSSPPQHFWSGITLF